MGKKMFTSGVLTLMLIVIIVVAFTGCLETESDMYIYFRNKMNVELKIFVSVDDSPYQYFYLDAGGYDGLNLNENFEGEIKTGKTHVIKFKYRLPSGTTSEIKTLETNKEVHFTIHQDGHVSYYKG